MSQTPRARRMSGAPVALFALSLVAISAAAQPPSPYEVVLKDGSIIAAATRPLIAMGKVSFLDGDSRAVAMSVQRVDVEATRARIGSPTSRSRTWTDRSLATVKGNIQVVGESEAPAAATDNASDSQQTATTNDGMTEAARVRVEIDSISAKMQPLGPKDRQRTLLMLRQLELQQELTRILRPPVTS